MELRKKGEDWITKVINKMICFLEGGPNLQGVLLPACQRCVNLHALNNGRGLLKAKINLSLKELYAWGSPSYRLSQFLSWLKSVINFDIGTIQRRC